jgi:hypothetical protein
MPYLTPRETGQGDAWADKNLRDRLEDVQIFRDVETIAPGEDFVEALGRALGDCAVMLVMIGPTWLDARDEDGKRRLDDPKDWVRLEVARALAQKVRAIPITCRGATEPKAVALPADIQPLCTKQAVEIDNNRWRYDVDRLIDRLVQIEGLRRRPKPEPVPGPSPRPSPLPQPVKSSGLGKGLLIGGAITFFALIFIGVLINESEKGGSAAPPPGSDPYSLTQSAEPEPRPAAKIVNTPAPAPAPAPAPTVQRQQPAALNGIWRSRDGEVYNFEQRGNEVAMTLQMASGIVGVGQGVLNGSMLQLVIALPAGNTQIQANCALQAAPDWRSFNGLCAGPAGQYAVSIFR